MFSVTKDIFTSRTLPTHFYTDQNIFEKSKDAIFRKSWHLLHDNMNAIDFIQTPLRLLAEFLDESLLIIKSDKKPSVDVMSNVCTHRGNLLVNEPNNQNLISCNYHGRCFQLDGAFKSMPFFNEVQNFPSFEDHLKHFEVFTLGPALFTTLGQDNRFKTAIASIKARMPDFNFDALQHIPSLSANYPLKAHWALYVDNYLEGFHVPFVHPSLGGSLDMNAYHYEVFENYNLQLGVAKRDEPCFNLSESSPDFGQSIFAYYWWVFPNLMLNCYPWGLSLNSIEPVSKELSNIHFETYMFDTSDAGQRSLTNIDITEMEDEAIVLQVQKGIKSSAYSRGRYSPVHEKCVHHFHQLIANRFEL